MQWIVASVPCHRGCTAPPLIITYEKACRFVVHRGVALQKRLVLCEKGRTRWSEGPPGELGDKVWRWTGGHNRGCPTIQGQEGGGLGLHALLRSPWKSNRDTHTVVARGSTFLSPRNRDCVTCSHPTSLHAWMRVLLVPCMKPLNDSQYLLPSKAGGNATNRRRCDPRQIIATPCLPASLPGLPRPLQCIHASWMPTLAGNVDHLRRRASGEIVRSSLPLRLGEGRHENPRCRPRRVGGYPAADVLVAKRRQSSLLSRPFHPK